jgi:phosphonate transport system substrate-binding protein
MKTSVRTRISILVAATALFMTATILVAFGSLSERSAAVVDFDDKTLDAPADTPAPGDVRPTLRVAVAAIISPEVTRRYYDDLLDLLGDRLGYRIVFIQKRTYKEVNDLLEHKEVDLAFVCAGPYVQGHRTFGLEILAVPVMRGQKVYRAYFLVGKNSGIKSLEDLRGKRFAFTDPDSHTGYLVPRFLLSQRGQTPESYFGEQFFTHSHDNSIKAVADGLADGAAVTSFVWEFMNAVDPISTAKTIIIEKSPPYGIPPVVVHPELEAHTKARLKQFLLAVHEDAQGAPLLRRLQIDRFEPGDDAMYDSVRQMQDWLEREKGRNP